jgi:hypothetical protein
MTQATASVPPLKMAQLPYRARRCVLAVLGIAFGRARQITLICMRKGVRSSDVHRELRIIAERANSALKETVVLEYEEETGAAKPSSPGQGDKELAGNRSSHLR